MAHHYFDFILLITALSQLSHTDGQQQCVVGRNLPPVGGSPVTSGQYLDRDHPAMCDGLLTNLSLCYLSTSTPGPFNLVLRVWREGNTRTLNMVREVTLKIETFTELSDSLYVCGNWTLDPAHYIELIRGDVLGVLFPLKSDLELLPVVTNMSNAAGLYRDTRESANYDLPLTDSDLDFKGDLSLNIYAEYAVENVLTNTTTPSQAASPQTSSVPIANPEPTKTSMLPSTEPQPTSAKVLVSSFIYLPTPSPTLGGLSAITPNVAVVSVPTSISTSKTLLPPGVTFSKTSYVAEPNSSSFGPSMTTQLAVSAYRSRGSIQPLPTLTQDPIVSTEPGLRFSLTLADTVSRTEVRDSGATLSTMPPLLSRPLASILSLGEVASKTIMIRPSFLGNDISTTILGSMSGPSVLSLVTTSVRNTFVSISETPLESSVREQLGSTVSRDILTITDTYRGVETSLMAGLSTAGITFPTPTLLVITPTSTLSPSQQVEHTPSPSSSSDFSPSPSLSPSLSPSPSHTPETFPSNSPLGLRSTEIPEATGTPVPSPTTDSPSDLHSTQRPKGTDALSQSPIAYVNSPSTSLPFTHIGTSSHLTLSLTPSETLTPVTQSLDSTVMSFQLPRQPPSVIFESSTTVNRPHISASYSYSTREHPSQTPVIPGEDMSSGAESLVSVVIAVCVLFATLSGCVMLSCTFIVHCRKISKVEQITRPRNIFPSIDNPSYVVKQPDESTCNLPLLYEESSDQPNLLNISFESTIDVHDNAVRNAAHTEHNSSQLAIKVATPVKSISATKRDTEVIELEDLKQESSPKVPAPRKGLSRSYTIEVVPVISRQAHASTDRHEYDEVKERQGRSTLTREHDYEEPVSPKVPPPRKGGASAEPPPRKKGASAYEEPMPRHLKRLSYSLPFLNSPSVLALPKIPRRNSSASELGTGGLLQSKKIRAKPGMILHYAEFSLIQSQEPTTQGAAGDVVCDRSATSAPSTQHEYEELPFLPHLDLLRPIPAPIRLLKGVSAYEVPVTKSPLHAKVSPPTALLSKMRLKLDHLTADINENFDDDQERLIESETESRDTNSEHLKSPGNDTLSSQDTINDLASTSSTMDGAYFFPSSNEEELSTNLKKLSIEIIPSTSIESKLTNEQIQHGVWRRDISGTKLDVTLKTVDSVIASDNEEICDGSAVARLLQEVVIMRQFRHPNILRLHGVVYENRHSILVSEYFPRGDLRKILVQMGRSVIPSDTPKLLLTYSQQVALGMQYLASKGFVHRDLCARNVFVTATDICKVGGFGKSRDLTDVSDYISKGGRIQVRWTAPEAMYYHQYSTASDVWSYGCLLYEIWSLGRMPFRDSTNAEVIEKVDSGYRLPPPPGCPRVIYNLMMQCWHPNPFSRPCFKDIINSLLRDEERILQIPHRDAATHESAIILGANLKTGAHMYADLQQTYTRRALLEANGGTAGANSLGHDYDHIQEEEFMFTFPTSSADLACEVKSKKSEGSRDYDEEDSEDSEGVSGGMSLVPQPSIYSIPVECDKSPFAITLHDSRNHFFEL